MNAESARRTPRPGLRDLARLVRFEHTLFALPFAFAGSWLAADGPPGWGVFGWVTLAMVGARTFAMALNRLFDAAIDAANPRTADREIPRGIVSRPQAIALALASLATFVIAGLALNPLTAALLPVAAAFMAIYPLLKRFTWWCHAWLGVTIGAAAAGGFIAVTGAFAPPALWLWLAVAAWIAGFDVIYAFLDLDFDRSHGVMSLPARFGSRVAARVAAGSHAVAAVALVATGWSAGAGVIYYAATALVIAVFARQHRWLARHGAAVALRAFDANLIVGAAMFLGVALDLAWRAP
jgi:4-hydroxybenzoate polyprenyltransferase